MKLKECFRKCVMYISLQERKKRTYQREKEIVDKFRMLPEIELNFEYVNLKSKYEHNKHILILFLIAVILAVINGAWSPFQNFIRQAMKYVVIVDETDFAITCFKVTLIFTIALIIIGVIFVGNYMKSLYRTYERLLLVELVRNEKI